MKSQVSIIIVNWNGQQYLKTCLPVLFKQAYKSIEVIVVDNASTDDSVSYLQTEFPQVKIVQNSENLGFAEANNKGYQHATGEYILFLNNDTQVTSSFLIELLAVFRQDPQIGAAQSKLLLMDKRTTLDSVGGFLTWSGFLYHYGFAKKDGPSYQHQIDLYFAKGACMMFRKEVIEAILVDDELFDHRYFAYFEETDVCHRVWLAGYRIVYAPKSVVYHKMGGTSKNIQSGFIQFHSFKNRLCSHLKNLGSVNLFIMLPIHFLFIQAFALFSIFINRNFVLLVAIERACIWNLLNLSDTLKKRRYIQHHLRKVSDQAIMSHIFKPIRLSYYYHLFMNLRGYQDIEIR
jgi:GT2 family glycosyltransferase